MDENCSLNMSVLLFFGKNTFETSCGRNTKWAFFFWTEAQSSKVETLHFQSKFSISAFFFILSIPTVDNRRW